MLTALDRGWGDPRKPNFRQDNIRPVEAGGIRLYVHKELVGITALFLTDITNRGYKLNGRADDWAYNFRPVRGYETRYRLTRNIAYLSNHSWGTALDLNATTNPMTRDGRVHTDMPDFVIGCAFAWGLSWGGYYHGARKDPMHFEYLGTIQEAQRKNAELKAFFQKH